MADLPSVTVVIPCRNAAPWLGEQLAAVTAQDYAGPLEVIVADNGSTDDSREIAAAWPGVTVLDASAVRGPNHARNVGSRAGGGSLILTCDADDVVDGGWVSAMVAALADFDLVGGHLEVDSLNPPEVRRRPLAAAVPKYGFLPIVSGGNFGIRRTVLEALGGWNEEFTGGPDDTELCWRAQLAGYRYGRTPDAVVHYRYRTTARAAARQAYDGGRRIPTLIRTFRHAGMSYRGIALRVVRFAGYLVAMLPLLPFSRRIRIEWVRRASLGWGFVRGLVSRSDEPGPRSGQ